MCTLCFREVCVCAYEHVTDSVNSWQRPSDQEVMQLTALSCRMAHSPPTPESSIYDVIEAHMRGFLIHEQTHLAIDGWSQ